MFKSTLNSLQYDRECKNAELYYSLFHVGNETSISVIAAIMSTERRHPMLYLNNIIHVRQLVIDNSIYGKIQN